MGSPRDDLMIPSTYVHVLIRHLLGILESIPLLTQNLGSLGITWSLLIQSIVERKKSKQHMDHDSMTQFSATFSHSLCIRLQILLPVAINPIFHLPLSQILHTDPINSLLHHCYIFFFQFSSPYKSSYRARRDKVWCGVSGSIMFLL